MEEKFWHCRNCSSIMMTTNLTEQPLVLIEEVITAYREYYNPSLARLMKLSGFNTVEWEASGIVVKDVRGREYLDFLGGYGVFAAGHRHPKIVARVKEQLERMPMSSKVFFNAPLALLAKKLAQITPGDLKYSFFCNSGAETVEGALKIARLATKRRTIVAAMNAFHGKTMGSLSASGRDLYKAPFEPLVPEFQHLPFGDFSLLEKIVNEETAAVIMEPIQGEGGIVMPPDDYFPKVAALCKERGVLLIADEVQTGLGRTGKLFAVEHWGVVPDLLLLAKALGGGVMPIGAIVGTPKVWEAFLPNPLIHTSTFGGNPLACAAALATLEVIEEENLVAKSKELGDYFLAELWKLAAGFSEVVKEVRGKGLLIGVELTEEKYGGIIFSEMIKRGVIVAYTLNQSRVIRFEPPLIVERKHIELCLKAFKETLEKAQTSFKKQ